MDILFVPFLTDTQKDIPGYDIAHRPEPLKNDAYVSDRSSVGNLPKVHNMGYTVIPIPWFLHPVILPFLPMALKAGSNTQLPNDLNRWTWYRFIERNLTNLRSEILKIEDPIFLRCARKNKTKLAKLSTSYFNCLFRHTSQILLASRHEQIYFRRITGSTSFIF